MVQNQFAPLAGSGQLNRQTRRADILLYLSDGELAGIDGLFINDEYHELEKSTDNSNYKIPKNANNSHYGKLQLRELFASDLAPAVLAKRRWKPIKIVSRPIGCTKGQLIEKMLDLLPGLKF